MGRILTLTACVFLLCATAIAGEADPSLPPALVDWKDAAYTQRYFLKVAVPGEAGNANLQKDLDTASVVLPLKMIRDVDKLSHPESLLLLAEDGSAHSVQWREAGSDVEIFFKTKPQSRRFCLYTGPLNGEPKRISPMSADNVSMRVRMRGRKAPPEFAYSDAKPLTLERFQKLEEANEGVVFPVRPVPNIDNPECPYFSVRVDQFGHIGEVINPLNYTALYEGFLRAPVDGDYKFALDTLGAAHLLIDGVALLSAPAPDPERLPLTLAKSVALKEGLHRVVVYYADACPTGQTAMSQRYFGVRLHWQPPFARGLMCIPPQAFPHAMPADVTRFESEKNYPQPFIQIENVGQVRVAAHRGDNRAIERAQIFARAIGGSETAILKISALGMAEISGPAGAPLAAWVPAGAEVKITLVSPETGTPMASRTLTAALLGKTSQDLIDLEAELEIKSSPDFLYPDEHGHIHMEAMVSPPPELIFKERLETNMLPPLPRPMGDYRVEWQLADAKAIDAFDKPEQLNETPLEGLRKKFRISLFATDVEERAKAGKTDLLMRLSVGGAPVEILRLRLLHSTSPWPAPIEAAADGLVLKTKYDVDDGNGGTKAEIREQRTITLVPKENESEYRKFAPLKALESRDLGKDALFLGDPLVEGVSVKTGSGALFGLAKTVAATMPGMNWKGVCVQGPHRGLPVFQIMAELDAFTRANGGKVPGLVILSLGGGDVARQTPLYTFERALDALIDRLRLGGAKKILVAGVVPEPSREKQCAIYQDRLADLLRQHHIDSVDIFSVWTKESDWVRNFSADGSEKVLGPVPNAQAREKIAQMIKDRL